MKKFTRGWRASSKVGLQTSFTLFWNVISWGSVILFEGGSVVVNGVPYSSFIDATIENPTIGAIFIFPLIGLMMAYTCLAMWINKTEIKMEGSNLILTRGPLPWPKGQIQIPASEIKQAYVQEYVSHSEHQIPVVRYQLVIQKFNGTDMILDNRICFYEDAVRLENWIETEFGIEDQVVPGEFQKAA